MTAEVPCDMPWGHAMHINPGGYCPGVWITGTSTARQTRPPAVPSTTEPNDQWVTAPDGEAWRVGACQGHSACPVDRHEHGCFADVGNCDHPEEHEPTEEEQKR